MSGLHDFDYTLEEKVIFSLHERVRKKKGSENVRLVNLLLPAYVWNVAVEELLVIHVPYNGALYNFFHTKFQL